MSATGYHLVSLLLYVLPEGDAAAGRDAFVQGRITIADGHALIVGIMDGQHLFLGETVPQTDLQRDVLHVAGYGMQL